jgi:hypothetical protein
MARAAVPVSAEPSDGAESRQRPAELKIPFRDLLIAAVRRRIRCALDAREIAGPSPQRPGPQACSRSSPALGA